MKNLAAIISLLFSPATLIPAAIILLLYQAAPHFNQFLKNVVFIFSVSIIPVFLLFLYLYKKRQIHDLDMQKRSDRYLFLSLVSVLCTVLFALAFLFASSEVFGVAALLWLWTVIFTGITFFWKISGHTTGATILLVSVIPYGPVATMATGFLLLTVAWARIYRKNHTPLQTIGGVILGLGVYFICVSLGLVKG